jgi:hypothetical protein
MPRRAALCLFVALMALSAVPALAIDAKDIAGEPAVYSKVVETPDPAMLGCFTRSRPSEFKRPNLYALCLVERGGKYAVFYDWMDGKTLEKHTGWMPFTIMKDRMTSDTDPSSYVLKDGELWHSYAGRDSMHRMRRDNP